MTQMMDVKAELMKGDPGQGMSAHQLIEALAITGTGQGKLMIMLTWWRTHPRAHGSDLLEWLSTQGKKLGISDATLWKAEYLMAGRPIEALLGKPPRSMGESQSERELAKAIGKLTEILDEKQSKKQQEAQEAGIGRFRGLSEVEKLEAEALAQEEKREMTEREKLEASLTIPSGWEPEKATIPELRDEPMSERDKLEASLQGYTPSINVGQVEAPTAMDDSPVTQRRPSRIKPQQRIA